MISNDNTTKLLDEQLKLSLDLELNTTHESITASVLNLECPVSELVELAQRLSTKTPDFEFGDEQGPCHNRIYTCHAKFGDFTETAKGKSKKAAKRLAALKLLYKINLSKLTDNKPTVEPLNSDVDLLKIYNRKLPNIYKQLKASKKPSIAQLLSAECDCDKFNKQFLDKLALEEKFQYKIYQKVTEGKFKVNMITQVIPNIFEI